MSSSGRPASTRRAPGKRLGLTVHVVDAHGRPTPARGLGRWLAHVAERRARGVVTVALVTDACVRRLNRQFRGVDRVTDVLSFPAGEEVRARTSRPSRRVGRASASQTEGRFLGDIVIATGQARRQAVAVQHDTDIELRVLALHGLLHLLGYDHDGDGGRMARLERRLRRAGRLGEGLIERVQSQVDAGQSVGLPIRARLGKSRRAGRVAGN